MLHVVLTEHIFILLSHLFTKQIFHYSMIESKKKKKKIHYIKMMAKNNTL